MQDDRRQLAGWWLNGARQDLAIAEDGVARWSNASCFHAQQSAEKALKAALVLASGDSARTHALVVLAAELVSAGTALDEPVLEACKVLDKFYAPTRYPDALGGVDPTEIFTEREAREAVSLARHVLTFAEALLKPDDALEPTQSPVVDTGI